MSVKCKSSLLNYSFLTDLLSSDINKVYLLITIIDNEKETTVSHPVVHRYLFIYIFYSVSAWFCFYSIIFFDSVWFRNVLLLVEIFKRSEIELNRNEKNSASSIAHKWQFEVEETIVLIIAAILIVYLSFRIFITYCGSASSVRIDPLRNYYYCRWFCPVGKISTEKNIRRWKKRNEEKKGINHDMNQKQNRSALDYDF